MKFIKLIKTRFFLFIYYSFARWLPLSNDFGGVIWKAIRFRICKQLFAASGKNVNIESRAAFYSGRTISIDDNSGIGYNSLLSGKITIGKNVMMGPEVMMFAKNHNFERTDCPMILQGFQDEDPIIIGDDVWIGARVIILPGVTIGRGVVLGAGAVVAKDIPDYAVVIGNPCQILYFRNKCNTSE